MIELQRGDIFATRSDKLFGRLIRLRDRLRSSDGEATYNHCGIITDSSGTTFEARRIITNYDLYAEYAGQQVIVARPKGMEFAKRAAARKLQNRYNVARYPWWRILLHAITPFLARKLHSSGVPVCSELVAEFLYLIGIRHGEFYGTTPDMLVDEWRKWRDIDIIFEGILPACEPASGRAKGEK